MRVYQPQSEWRTRNFSFAGILSSSWIYVWMSVQWLPNWMKRWLIIWTTAVGKVTHTDITHAFSSRWNSIYEQTLSKQLNTYIVNRYLKFSFADIQLSLSWMMCRHQVFIISYFTIREITWVSEYWLNQWNKWIGYLMERCSLISYRY